MECLSSPTGPEKKSMNLYLENKNFNLCCMIVNSNVNLDLLKMFKIKVSVFLLIILTVGLMNRHHTAYAVQFNLQMGLILVLK